MSTQHHRLGDRSRSLGATTPPGLSSRLLSLVLASLMTLGPGAAWAGSNDVEGLEGVVGNVCVNQIDDGSVVVQQFDPTAKLIWSDFPSNIVVEQADSSVRLHNQVNSAGGTYFNGTLTAGGILYLTDAMGVRIGPDAIIDAARFVAAGGVLSWNDFLAGREHFSQINGDVINEGRIHADSVALLGRRVANYGEILAEDTLIMVSGNEAWIGERGSPVVIRLPLPDEGADAEAEGGEAESESTPAVGTDDPGVELAAGDLPGVTGGSDGFGLGAGDPLAYAIHHTGTSRAREIILDGGDDSRVVVSGRLDATGTGAGEYGGEITILGGAVALIGAEVDVSGTAGGGRVRIGGDYQGKGEVRNALFSYVDGASSVRADALEQGDGGTLIVWSDDTTAVRGTLSARGGATGGDGGFAEVSGKQLLDIAHFPDLGAPAGDGGTLLLDPSNISIVEPNNLPEADVRNLDSAFDNLFDPLFQVGASNPLAIRPEADDSQISAGVTSAVDRNSILFALSQGVDVILVTDTFETDRTPAGDGHQDGNIYVNAPIILDDTISIQEGTSARLRLAAANDIEVNAPIINTSSDLSLDIELLANDRTQDDIDLDLDAGSLTISQDVQTSDGNIVLDGWDVTIGRSADGSTLTPATVSSGGGIILVHPLLSGIPDAEDLVDLQGGSVTLALGSRIETDGGQLGIGIEGIEIADGSRVAPSVVIDGTIDTSSDDGVDGNGGEVRVLGTGADFEMTGSIASEGGPVSVLIAPRRFIDEVDVQGETVETFLDIGGTLRVDSPNLASQGGSIALKGHVVEINDDIDTEGGDLAILDAGFSEFNEGAHQPDSSLIASSIRIADGVALRTEGGTIRMGLTADGLIQGGTLTIGNNAIIDARDSDAAADSAGPILVTVRDQATIGSESEISGRGLLFHAGINGEGDLIFVSDDADGNGIGTVIRGDAIELLAGRGFADPLVVEDPITDPDQLARLRAIDASGQPVAFEDLAISLRNTNGDGPPELFTYSQDAAIMDGDVLPLAAFVDDPGTEDLQGMQYLLSSGDGDVAFSQATKVDGSALELSAVGTDTSDGPTGQSAFAIPLLGGVVQSLKLSTNRSLEVTSALAASVAGVPTLNLESGLRARAEQTVGVESFDEITGDLVIPNGVAGVTGFGGSRELGLHAGATGYGDLVVGDGVKIWADDIALSAGIGFLAAQLTNPDSEVFIDPGAELRDATGGAAPARFSVAQDASISDAQTDPVVDPDTVPDALPSRAQLCPIDAGGCLAGTDYGIRSYAGGITLTDASKVEFTDLQLLALNEIRFDPRVSGEKLELYSVDLGGIESYQVPVDLLSQIDTTSSPGKQVYTLRAGAGPFGQGVLSFQTADVGGVLTGVTVRGDEVHLVASSIESLLDQDARTSRIDLDSIVAPVFSILGSVADPGVFTLRAAGDVVDSETAVGAGRSVSVLPTDANFDQSAIDAVLGTFAARSDYGSLTLQSPQLDVPLNLASAGQGLVVAAEDVLIGRFEPLGIGEPWTDLNLTFEGTRVHIHGDEVSLLAREEIDPDQPPTIPSEATVDFSDLQSLAGFSPFSSEGDPDPIFGITVEPDLEPEVLNVVQDGRFTSATDQPDPGQVAFDQVTVNIRSANNSIDLSDWTRWTAYDGSKLNLTIEGAENSIRFPELPATPSPPAPVLESLVADLEGQLIVGQGNGATLLEASDLIDIHAGLSGLGDLDFAGSVRLKANRIVLEAGNGFLASDYTRDDNPLVPNEANLPSVNAIDDPGTGKTVVFEFTRDASEDPEAAEPTFAMTQDAVIELADLPLGAQLAFSGDASQLDGYVATVLEGIIEVVEVEDESSQDLIFAVPTIELDFTTRSYVETIPDFQTRELGFEAIDINIRQELASAPPGGDVLDFDVPDPNFEQLRLGAANIRFEAPSIAADTDKLSMYLGALTSGSLPNPPSPLRFTLRQDDAIDAVNLPDRDSFEGGTERIDYTVISNDGGIMVADNAPSGTSSFADKVLDADLLLIADNGRVSLLDDLELNFLTVVSDPGETGDPTQVGIELGPVTIDTAGIEINSQGEIVRGRETDTHADQRYLGPVTLLSDGGAPEAVTLNGFAVEFASTVDGDAILDVNARHDAIFRDDVGSSVALNSLAVDTDVGSNLNGGLYAITFGGVADAGRYPGPVGVDEPTHEFEFLGRGLVDIVGERDPGTGELVDPLIGLPLLTARAIDVHTIEDIALNTDPANVDLDTLATIPNAATIYQPGDPDYDPTDLTDPSCGLSCDLSFTSDQGSFQTGVTTRDVPGTHKVEIARFDKITSMASLSISAQHVDNNDPNESGRVTIGDIAALEDLTIYTPTLELMRRIGGDVLRSDGSIASDAGVSYTIGRQLTLARADNDPTVPTRIFIGKEGNAPVFGITDTNTLPAGLTDADGNSLFPVASLKPYSTALVPDDLRFLGRVLDYVPFGPSRADLTGALPELLLPRPRVQPPVLDAVWDRVALERVGVDARRPTPQEFSGRMARAAVFDDVAAVAQWTDDGRITVVNARLRGTEVDRAAGLYQEVFGIDRQRVPEIRATLQAVVDDYRSSTGARRVVGFELRRYVRNRPNSQLQAYALLEELNELFRHHRRLGLSPGESERIQRGWLVDVTPEGITVDELAETIHPSRYVRGSDILDVFGD